jgi:hypothetical protein
MRPLPVTLELLALARRVVWFEEPAQALSDPARLVAYAMTYGTHEDMKVLRGVLSDDDLRDALAEAPPGVFDERSWAYWNLVLGRWPAPAMRDRVLP